MEQQKRKRGRPPKARNGEVLVRAEPVFGDDRFHAPHGFTSRLAEGGAFLMRLDEIVPRWSSGLGANPRGERVVYVVHGSLHVSMPSGTRRIFAGAYFRAPAGAVHSYATDSDGATIVIVETAGYADGWIAETAPVEAQRPQATSAAMPPRPATPSGLPVQATNRPSRAKAQLEALQRERERRNPRKAPRRVDVGGQPVPEQSGGPMNEPPPVEVPA